MSVNNENDNVYNISFFQVSLFVDNEQLLRVKDQFSRRLLGVNGTDFSRLLVPSYFSCLKLSDTTFVRSYGYVKLGWCGF